MPGIENAPQRQIYKAKDPLIDRIVATWPPRFATARGQALGMRADSDFEGIVRAHMQDQARPRAWQRPRTRT